MSVRDFNTELLEYIASSPTPFHAASTLSIQLQKAGYQQLQEGHEWELCPGKYYVLRNDSSLIAFSLPDMDLLTEGFRMVGAHTDSPCLKIKPSPVVNSCGYIQLGAEIYGGVLLNPWFDRDLSVAGRVTFSSAMGVIESRLIDFRRPLAIIPSLAIHLDRTANEERRVNAQTDMVPVLMLAEDEDLSFQQLLQDQLMQEHGDIGIGKILDYELSLYDCQAPAIGGFKGQFISSARLDNLVSCYVGLKALLDSDDSKPSMLVCFDHEEVGSMSAAGAQGPFLRSVLERLCSTPEEMVKLGYKPVGSDFPVFLHPETGEEYALARTERKQGHGYHGFTVDSHPGVTLEEDLKRRDLTINAMARGGDGELIDPYGGAQDLKNRVLRHVSPAFSEDPLRVLRVARFAARLADHGFHVDESTMDLGGDCRRHGGAATRNVRRGAAAVWRAGRTPA